MKYFLYIISLATAFVSAEPHFIWTKNVAADNLTADSAAVPSMVIDQNGKVVVSYLSTRSPGNSYQLMCAKETGDNGPFIPYKITPFNRGDIVSLTFNGDKAMTAANKPTGGVAFYSQGGKPVSYKITKNTLNKVDSRIFSSFMERPSWHGEIGIEAGTINGTHKLQPKLIEKLRELHSPVYRFPGGTDIDHTDWTDMIDNVPGRTNSAGQPLPRPVTIGHLGGSVSNFFGYDEFYDLMTNLSSEAIIPVNFRDAVKGVKSLSDAALHAASLVAYCNAEQGAALPAGMINWPAVRATNGHTSPFGIGYFQIGNETWFFDDGISANTYADYVKAYVDKMREVDPNIQILVDAISADQVAAVIDRIGTNGLYIVQHDYMPWQINNGNLKKDGSSWTVDKLSMEDIWYAWVGIPNTFNSHGESIIGGMAIEQGRNKNLPVAVTEWNWNGWWDEPGNWYESITAQGLGDAGYLQAYMRAGDVVSITCQSMTVGKHWSIDSIRVSDTGEFDPFFLPSGMITMFYSKYHGNNLLDIERKNVPTYKQPFKMHDIFKKDKVAIVDALVTENSTNIFFHAINRHFTKDIPVTIDVSEFPGVNSSAIHRKLQFSGYGWYENTGPEIGYFTNTPVTISGNKVTVTLPKRSVSIIQFTK
ncbi:hypothetical protein KAH27_05950 [bacterium]|nr:hypothetical protein [bacterium]